MDLDTSAAGVDGAVCMLRELALVDPAAAGAVLPCVVAAAAAFRVRTRHGLPAPAELRLVDTLFRTLPDVAASVGKPAVKRCLDDVIALLCACLQQWGAARDTQNTVCAAGDCAAALAACVGPTIFAGRLSAEQRAVIARSDAAARLRHVLGMGGGPPGGSR